MKRFLLALVWAGILIGATSACSSYCNDCSNGICLDCSFNSYYSTSQQDCVFFCFGTADFSDTHGAFETCHDGSTSRLVLYIVLPIVGVLCVIVLIVYYILLRRKRARMNSRTHSSVQPVDQSPSYPNQDTVSAGIPIAQENPPEYQDGMYQPGIQQVVLPQTDGWDQNGLPIQGGDAQFTYQAQDEFNQGGYANTGDQGQVVDMQP